MKRNRFGSPRPANAEEIIEALDGRDTDDVNAEISHSAWEPDGGKDAFEGLNMTGYSAEIRENDSGEEVATTIGFESEAELRQMLTAAGITDISSAED